ncbi:GNAT family N-acetyltransferase [Pseudoalteromonas sp. SWN29]|uniref:GNAT family N-acetyltransferase n=1 Tax=Pseudoalteromonas sp. SWN29 TaxID=2792064 RepID=UPI0018CFC7A8|nr:GNAT family N-acetyltransferase [Pseudoalteromonas sp. SWN29]MBH0026257.1 GNAT family N-acetyltransferase [Pseudoalteromonas sp. SWN29]
MHIQIAKHIKLAPLVESDAADILKTVNLSRASLGEFLPWVEEVNNIESAKKYILDRVNSGLNGSRWFKIYYKDLNLPDNFSGVFAVKSICPDLNIAELGYWLSSVAQGNGIISQVIAKVPSILKNTSTKVIEFRCLEQNVASIKIALKSGASLVNTIPNFVSVDNTLQQLNIYQVTL